MKKLLILGLILFVGLIISGCPDLLGSQLLLEYEADTIHSGTDSVGHTNVDLTDDEDYVDHRDEIVGLDYVRVGAVVINNGDQPVSGVIYFTTDLEDVESLREYYEPALTIAEIAPGDTLSFSSEIAAEAYGDFDYFMSDGRFYAYAVGDQDEYDIEATAQLNIMVYINPDETTPEE
jgi:hypothetical protein